MSRPLLPPRGIFIPTGVMYNPDFSPTVIHTWIQLRGLAWDRTETPQLSMRQLSDITGKSPSTLYGHLAHLRSWGALRMRPSVKGTFIVTFPADNGDFYLDGDSLPDQEDISVQESGIASPAPRGIPETPPGGEGGNFPDSRNLESPDPPPSSQPDQIVSVDSEEREDFNPRQGDNQLDPSRGRDFQNSGPGSRIPELPHDIREGTDSFQEFGLANPAQSGNPEPPLRDEGGLPPELDGADPVKIYQKVTGIRPKQLQREHLQAHIQETDIWFASLKHWIFHGWNPKNITGMIQLYRRGGPSACRYCSKEGDSQDETLSVIQQMREEYRSRNYDNY